MARTVSFIGLLFGLFIPVLSHADDVPPAPNVSTQPVQQAVARATNYLRTESAAWLSTRTCAACHHVPMALSCHYP